jgi:hypothetical protein
MEALAADRNRLSGEFDRITHEAADCMRDATACHLATFQPPSKPLPRNRAGVKMFAPALDRDWVGGKASPQLSVGSGANNFIARGNMMKLDLPHLFRIHKFSATVKINANVEGFSTLFVNLQRMALDGTNPQHVVGDLGIPFALGLAEVAGFPSPESELIDNHLFQYFVNAVYAVRNANPTTTIVPAEAVVWQSFAVEFSSG